MLKSVIAGAVFHRCRQVKKQLWGGEFWTDGYFAGPVDEHGNEEMIGNYVKNEVKE